MATDITIYVEDEPGALGRLGEVLGEGDVNIEGFFAVNNGTAAEIHVLVEDPLPIYSMLSEAGIEIAADQEVAVIDVEDRPGALGEISRILGDAGSNITIAYLATRTRLVFGADDLARAKATLSGI